MALALLAGSFPVAAQFCPTPDGEVNYRSREVKAAYLDNVFKDVKKINSEYWYQLQVSPASLGIKAGTKEYFDTYVLTAERDYSTGKIYLTAQKVTDATLTHSLWKIERNPREVSSRAFSFKNRETGYELTFDHVNALQRSGSGIDLTSDANKNWDFEFDGLMDGCNKYWSWYTTEDNGATTLPLKSVWSYFHNTDSVMYMKAVSNADRIANKVYADNVELTKALGVNGPDGTPAKGYMIVTVKDSKANAGEYLAKISDELIIKPVVAGAKVLNAAEINTMIDGDGSYLTFATSTNDKIANYRNDGQWSDAQKNEKTGLSTKFTVYSPETGEPMDFHSNPFANEFVAVQAAANEKRTHILNRDYFTAKNANTQYAGYDVLFETKDPILVDQLGQKQYGYLYVSENTYEGEAFQGVYSGLKVEVSPYAYLNKNTKNVVLKYDKDGTYIDNTLYTGTLYTPDALQARYHWKVTYYATNDSLVLEPLNASRMSQSDYTLGKKFEEAHLANAKVNQFLNTINEGKAYSGSATDPSYNTMYNKKAGVPVALYAMNFGPYEGDVKSFLTVAYGTGMTLDGKSAVDASDVTYAAVWNKKVLPNTSAYQLNLEQKNPAWVTNNSNAVDEKYGKQYQSAMKLHLLFNRTYNNIDRATVPTGLYYINLKSKNTADNPFVTQNRVEGAYIVEDMMGHVVYDIEEDTQDFSHMPATQWVVEQQPCEIKTAEGNVNYNEFPTVRIYNREFANCVFNGQLYKDKDGNLFTIDHRYYKWDVNADDRDKHDRRNLNCNDLYAFNPVSETTLGYFNAPEEVLRENVYRFQSIYDGELEKVLGINDLKAQMDIVRLMPETADDLSCEFELFRAEGWYPMEDSVDVIINGQLEKRFAGTYSFDYTDSLKYGYTSGAANARQLYKTYYKVKLKDANLIDNDHRFLAINNQHKYVIAREADILKAENNLQFAIVSLKEDACMADGTHAYAIVNAERYTVVTGATKDELQKLTRKVTDPDKFGVRYEEYSNKAGEVLVRRALTGVEFGEDPENGIYGNSYLNHYNVEGKLATDRNNLQAYVATPCESTSDVFVLSEVSRPLYRDLAATGYADLVNNGKKAIDIKTVDIQGNESLIEDSHSQQASFYKMNYLGAENYGDPSKNEGFYVDFVQASKDSRMPQYMFVVAADSVPAYTYCDCDIHDVKHGINSDCGHSENYAGYVDGRFLVNFNDSVKAAIDKLIPGVDKFAFDNYTRLGFVEAVHRGDSLYVLKAPYTLESIKEASVDPADNGKKFINPLYLSKDSLGKVYDIVPLNGKHNNVAFALRNTEDAEGSFVIESNDLYNDPETGLPQSKYSKIGSFAGAWIKIHNNVPVLAKFYDKNGDHNTGDTTDSWLNMGDWAPVANGDEVINQAARFTFSAIEKDSQATANEEIATSSVIVAGTNGAVVVKGAEGKSVIVSTILGKVVANEVVSSDNATIAAPQGVVVVSVDGESFKVVVK